MMKRALTLAATLLTMIAATAQNGIGGMMDAMGRQGGGEAMKFGFSNRKDSTQGSNKIVPVEVHQWKIEPLLGEVLPMEADTLHHQYQNWHFTEGMNGEYNFLGNLGAPRQSRIFFHRKEYDQFIFLQPYDYFVIRPGDLYFTDTKSPYTNLSYQSSGDKIDGDDRFKAYFSTSANRHFGVGFIVDILYGRGRYDNQATSFTDLALFSYYRSDHYGYHLYAYNNHLKMAENGGITDDRYITAPEQMSEGKKNFGTRDIPTRFSQTWNRCENFTAYFTQHYDVGFYRQEALHADGSTTPLGRVKRSKKAAEEQPAEAAPADSTRARPDSLPAATLARPARPTKAERTQTIPVITPAITPADTALLESSDSIVERFIPVTRFTHTAHINSNERKFYQYRIPQNYYAMDYMANDSVDATRYLSVKNVGALSLMEGFNKWVPFGLTAYAGYEYRRFTLPDTLAGGGERRMRYSEHNVTLGARLLRTLGTTWHFDLLGETTIAGEEMGAFKLDAKSDLNFGLWNDTVHFTGHLLVRNSLPSFYYRHYHSQHYWWDNSLSKELSTRIGGELAIDRWGTRLSAGVENIKNYTYFANTSQPTANGTAYLSNVAVRQQSDNIQIVSATLSQQFKAGILHLDVEGTLQKSSDETVLPLPLINAYGNLYISFRIAKVLQTELGADVRYFTRYYAPDYAPGIGQFTLQDPQQKIEIGNYPVVNLYVNFNLKRTRFYAQMFHVNEGMGDRNYFLAPHYPLNPRLFMLGLSWNFYD